MGVKVKFRAGAWWLSVHHGGRRKSKRIGDRETAVRVAKQVRERLAQGVTLRQSAWSRPGPVPPKGNSPRRDCERVRSWLAEISQRDTESEHSAVLHREHGPILPLLGDRPVGSLTRTDCRQLIANGRSRGLKVATVRGVARTLSALLSQLVEDEKLPANPALRLGRYLRRGDEAKTVIEPLTREEAALLVTTSRRHFSRWHAWIMLGLRTGLRLGEQIGLQWADIDWNGRFLLVQRNIVRGVLTTPKSHQRRRVGGVCQVVEK